jgi:probable phosphoglycerate mutase
MLILVRHGRTSGNARSLLQGRLDLPLDDVGTWQAKAVGWALAGVDRVVSSPLERARATAAQISRDVDVDERWLELDYGAYDGRPLSDIPVEEWAKWRADPHYQIAGGETLASLSARVIPALEELAEEAKAADIVVVSHVSPIKAAIAWALGVGVEISWRCQLDQASISRVAIGGRGPSLRSFNETAHLESAAPHPLP